MSVSVKREITRLAVMLARAEIPFELVAHMAYSVHGDEPAIQIASPSKEHCKIDAICHCNSYGGREGPIEIMADSDVTNTDDGVLGWLMADDAFRYFVRALK